LQASLAGLTAELAAINAKANLGLSQHGPQLSLDDALDTGLAKQRAELEAEIAKRQTELDQIKQLQATRGCASVAVASGVPRSPQGIPSQLTVRDWPRVFQCAMTMQGPTGFRVGLSLDMNDGINAFLVPDETAGGTAAFAAIAPDAAAVVPFNGATRTQGDATWKWYNLGYKYGSKANRIHIGYLQRSTSDTRPRSYDISSTFWSWYPLSQAPREVEAHGIDNSVELVSDVVSADAFQIVIRRLAQGGAIARNNCSKQSTVAQGDWRRRREAEMFGKACDAFEASPCAAMGF
jgi:hypothetical protein